jgi:hypothetical protein
MSQEESSIFWEVTVSAIQSKKLYTYMCPILNGFRERAISPQQNISTTIIDFALIFHNNQFSLFQSNRQIAHVFEIEPSGAITP